MKKDLGPRASDLGQSWRPPTRRTFVAMLAAAAIALRAKQDAKKPELPKWIGHL